MTREEMVMMLESIHGVATGDREFYATGAGMKDFNALLKAVAGELRPRVMTLEEVINRAKTPAWLEPRNSRGRPYTGWVLIYDVQDGMGITGTRVGVTEPGHVTIWPNVELYGQKWRCWTGEPTEEQRRATPWS